MDKRRPKTLEEYLILYRAWWANLPTHLNHPRGRLGCACPPLPIEPRE